MVRNQNKPWNTTGGQILDAVRREMDEFVGRIQDPETWTDDVSAFIPRTNVAETDSQYEISLDLPGMKADDFNIELHEGRLTVSGERAKEAKVEGKTFHRVERRTGKFRRTFNLGPDMDVDAVTAEYKDGVLSITIAKTAKAQPKRIHVKTQD
jgi:HSP20 family protein